MSRISRHPFLSPPSGSGSSKNFFFDYPYLHGATCEDFGVVAHMHEGKGLTCKVDDPITWLVVTRRDESAFLAVQGAADLNMLPHSRCNGTADQVD